MHYDHELPPTPTSAQSADIALFIEWRKFLNDVLLDLVGWMTAFRDVAFQHAKVIEQLTVRQSCGDWASWLRERPARGLGRQHRMSRCAIGWISTQIETPADNVLTDLDGTNGRSPEELDLMTTAANACRPRLTPSSSRNSEANH